jgi:hypothetical protein
MTGGKAFSDARFLRAWMPPKDPLDAVSLTLEALEGLGLEPKPVGSGMIGELRGGLRCIDITHDWLDSVVVMSGVDAGRLLTSGPGSLYKVDYAIRGSIKGVLSGRIVVRTAPEFKGLLRRKLVGLGWEVPEGGGGSYVRPRFRSTPPGPGEIWEGGPHQELRDGLNGDSELMASMLSFMSERKRRPLIVSVVSDPWDESMRICGDVWLEPRELRDSYISPVFLEIVSRIGGHVKDTRRKFGGLTF